MSISITSQQTKTLFNLKLLPKVLLLLLCRVVNHSVGKKKKKKDDQLMVKSYFSGPQWTIISHPSAIMAAQYLFASEILVSVMSAAHKS